MMSIIHQSNVFGTINPIEELIQKAKQNNTVTLIDAAQSIPSIPIDVQDLGCDFLVFSGHKMLGPTGVGVLYGTERILDSMNPFLSGGQMIQKVTLNEVTFSDLPLKFEAGTPNIAQVIGLGEAILYLSSIGMNQISEYKKTLTQFALDKLSFLENIIIYGNPKNRGSVISFNISGINSMDLAQVLDQYGICMRAGHHCAQPIMNKLKIDATARISFYLYNTKEEIEYLYESIKKAILFFRK